MLINGLTVWIAKNDEFVELGILKSRLVYLSGIVTLVRL